MVHCSYLKLINLPLSPLPLLSHSLPPLKIPVANHIVFTCFGPSVEDGYGIGFIPQDDQILFGISSFHHAQHPDTGSKQYIQKLKEFMREMHNVMAATRGLTSTL